MDSAGSAPSARPEPPRAWGLRAATQLPPQSPRWPRAPAEGRTLEGLTAEDALFLGAGLARVRGEGWVGWGACKKAREKEPGFQMDGVGALPWVWWEHSSTLFLNGAGGGLRLPEGVGAGGPIIWVPQWAGAGFWVPQEHWGLTFSLSKVLRARKWYLLNHPCKRTGGRWGEVLIRAGAEGLWANAASRVQNGARLLGRGGVGRRHQGAGAGTAHGDSSGDTGGCEIRPREVVCGPRCLLDSRPGPDSEPGDWVVGPRKAPSP